MAECNGFGGGCHGMDCPVCNGARHIQQLRNDGEDGAADHILDLRGRAETAEAQLQDAWREIACSDDITGPTLCGAINQLQRAREAAEAALADAMPDAQRWRLVAASAVNDGPNGHVINAICDAIYDGYAANKETFDARFDREMTTPNSRGCGG